MLIASLEHLKSFEFVTDGTLLVLLDIAIAKLEKYIDSCSFDCEMISVINSFKYYNNFIDPVNF